jgi:hypothetical protein
MRTQLERDPPPETPPVRVIEPAQVAESDGKKEKSIASTFASKGFQAVRGRCNNSCRVPLSEEAGGVK